jgi:hypothetical protein
MNTSSEWTKDKLFDFERFCELVDSLDFHGQKTILKILLKGVEEQNRMQLPTNTLASTEMNHLSDSAAISDHYKLGFQIGCLEKQAKEIPAKIAALQYKLGFQIGCLEKQAAEITAKLAALFEQADELTMMR